MNVPDNYSMWEAYEARIEAARERFPICSHCGERIYEERLFDIDGELYHPECAVKEFCKFTEDYIK